MHHMKPGDLVATIYGSDGDIPVYSSWSSITSREAPIGLMNDNELAMVLETASRWTRVITTGGVLGWVFHRDLAKVC